MTNMTLEPQIEELEGLFRQANPRTRSILQKDIESLVRRLRRERGHPRHYLRRLEALMTEDSDEDLFDNMPV